MLAIVGIHLAFLGFVAASWVIAIWISIVKAQKRSRSQSSKRQDGMTHLSIIATVIAGFGVVTLAGVIILVLIIATE